uniref:Coat protein n=1 Tax=Lily virus X TaxID=12194 RepID=A0A2Z5ULS1_LVX|nr:coat protein [Lily virus X]
MTTFVPDAKTWADTAYTAQSESVATAEELQSIATLWEGIGISAANFFDVAFQLAMRCSDGHASSLTVLSGNCTVAPTVTLKAAAGLVKAVLPLRQFCRYYAKFVWNWRLSHDLPPANWADSQFPAEARFAAFDFFDGVTNSAAPQPPDGLIRPPTELELSAAQTAKFAALARVRGSGFVTTAAEITHGRAEVSRAMLLSPP